MKKQFESLNSDKFSEQKLSAEAMLKQRGGKAFDTTEHKGDTVNYIYANGLYYKTVTWGDNCPTCCTVDTSDKIFPGTRSEWYTSAGS